MLIGNLKNIIAPFIALLLVACNSDTQVGNQNELVETQPNIAWWLSVEVPAKDEKLFGKPLKELKPEWRAVSVLSRAVLQTMIGNQVIDDLDQTSFAFSIESKDVQFIVGVYEARDGSGGRFVAVDDEGEVSIMIEEGPRGFSALLDNDGEMYWYKCLQCGDYDVVTRGEATYHLR